MSKKVTVSDDGNTATVADAKVGDILSTVVSTDSAVTGVYGLAQKILLVGGGMMINSLRLRDSFNPLVK